MNKAKEKSRPSSSKDVPMAPSLPVTELAACCLLKLNRSTMAEDLFRKAGKDSDSIAYYMGISLAHQGRVAEAVIHLERATRYRKNEKPAKQALLALLKKQAEVKIRNKEWNEACAVLMKALSIDPANAEIQGMLTAIGHHLPVAYLKSDKRAQAAAEWEKAQKENPGDWRITHCLSLLYFWHAQDLEAKGRGKEAVSAWRGAIRNWVTLHFSGNFWDVWKEKRERVCGVIQEPDLEQVRRELMEKLSRRLTDFQNDYLTRKQADDAVRMNLISLELAAELRTAKALQQVLSSLQKQGRREKIPPLCGVLMLKHLGELKTAQRLLEVLQTTQTSESSAEHLYWCLSPWVLGWIMVEERRYEEAIQYLLKEVRQGEASSDGNDLLAIAFLERGKLLAEGREVERALDCWELALKNLYRRKNLTEKIKQEVEDASVKEVLRLQNNGTADLDRGIKLLDRARQLNDSRRIRENLSELHTSLGTREGNDEARDKSTRFSKARKHLERALELNSGNGRAQQNLASVMAAEAWLLRERGKVSDAVALLRRAHKMSPGDDNIRSGLSAMITSQAIDRGNDSLGRGDVGGGLAAASMLKEALDIDPSNEHARKNLLALLKALGVR